MERLSQDSLDENPGDVRMGTEEPAAVLARVYPKEAVPSAGSPDVHSPKQMRVSEDTETSDGIWLVTPDGERPAGASPQGEHHEEGYYDAMDEEGSGLVSRQGGSDHEDIEGEREEEKEEI